MAKKSSHSTIDLALQSVYKLCVEKLTPKTGESFLAVKVENGKFANAVFGQNANVALAIFQFMTVHPEILGSFFSILLENSDFCQSYLDTMVSNSPDKVIESLRKKFLVVAIPDGTPELDIVKTLDKIKSSIIFRTQDEKSSESDKDTDNPAEEKA